MKQARELLAGHAQVGPQKPDLPALHTVWLAYDCLGQCPHQGIHVRDDGVLIPTLAAMDELDALEDDVLESLLHELIVATDYLCGTPARAALNVAHPSLLLASSQKTVIKQAMSAALKLTTTTSHLPLGSLPSTRYFHSAEPFFRKFFPKVSGWLDPAVRQAALQLGAGRLRIKVPA